MSRYLNALLGGGLLISAVSAQAAMIKGPVYLQWPGLEDVKAHQLKYKGKGRYAVTVNLPKGSYSMQIADEEKQCGKTFGPEQSSRLKFNQNAPLSSCANDGTYEVKILFAGDYLFTLDNADADKPTLKVIRKTQGINRQTPAAEGGLYPMGWLPGNHLRSRCV